MYGVVTRNAEEVRWPEFDRGFYEVKDVTGRSTEPIEDGVNMVSCFGDNAAADADPSLVAVDDFGRPATRDRKYFDWAYICPSRADYREGLFEIIDDCVEANEDVRLDDIGFPRPEYCRCGVCEESFKASEYEDRFEWRASVITEFVEEAADRIPGRVYMTLYPDPYPGHLYERAGIDLEAVEEHVDEFVVPLYDMAYETTYWLETIAKGFESALETPFNIELYAINIDIDNLVHAAEVAEAYGNDVFFGYEASNARGALRRMRADERDGVTHGDPDTDA
ncbi:hypothetical protein [Natronorubrum bangense]|uniref:Glycoside hydrolase domain protein n=2 Tax=Natronorubrum bangense TaxID=61858 RepID=L9WN15_9EURY|nr:hypothetical protein [Natronorubrum bangense]ELY49733.1 hypothetical protein C494_06960 [Natronorubrum bangense JCM 10635]QCC55364.1 hypothetical protein DV706_13360 [Natronorubrum bangense]